MVRRLPLLIVGCVAMLTLAGTASLTAAESVWSGLVMANNVGDPAPIPAELQSLEGTLKQLFGYNQFQIIGQSRNTLPAGDDSWTAASKYFQLQVNAVDATSSGYVLRLQLFQEQNLLLETKARLTKRSPLVIKGPQVGDGQLVLVLVLE